MKSRYITPAVHALVRVCVLLALTGALGTQMLQAQTTPGGTNIQNQASAAYTDGSGNNFSTVSNTVTTTVANVSGLVITPDAGTRPTVVAGQAPVRFAFRVTNTGNFADQVRFLAGGASIRVTGPATITGAVIDLNGDGNVDASEPDIFGNAADVISASLAQNGFIDIAVATTVNAGAVNGDAITVFLGDAATGSPTFDNQPANTSANEVRTVSTASVNGLREARGDETAIVENDAQLRLTLTAPTGPVSLGTNITYSYQVSNPGTRPATAQTLTGAPAGSNTGIFIISPIPVGTVLRSGQTFPAGTLFTTSPLTTNPLTATYTTTPPATLSTLTRIAFNVGNTLAIGASSAAFAFDVTITTTDATNPIREIGDVFGRNSVGGALTDQSGDTASDAGDGNANFTEGPQSGNTDGDGIVQETTLINIGSVLIGPQGQPGAVGPTNNNDDYTNHSVTTGIAGVAFGGTTTASGTVIYSNTVQNTGNANDTFTLTAPVHPGGFTVEISTNGGGSYTTVQPGNGNVTLPLAFGTSANILVRITAPAGLSVTTGYDTVIRVTSNNTAASFNDTIDRLYTGFLRLDKTATITNATGIGAATDPVPGADIEYVISYSNVSSGGGTNNATLTVNGLVITEDGNAAPNNWGTTTDQVAGSASDTLGGIITGDVAGSNLLTDTVSSLIPGEAGVFRFKRKIK